MPRSFTLIELIMAVAVLVVLLAVAGGIFQAVVTVTAAGMATADLLAQAAAIERVLRSDFERLSREGFLAIRCVGVRNDVNHPGPLLAPALAPDAVLRADQIIFFTQGVGSVRTFRAGAGVNRKGTSTVARVYYGHAFQLPGAPPVERSDGLVWAIDPLVDRNDPLVPWTTGACMLVRTRFQNNATDSPGDYIVDGDHGTVDATQPPAHKWLLARQSVILADDGGSPNVFLFTLREGGFRSTAWIDDAVIVNGRVDAAASRLDDIRRVVLDPDGDGVVDPWPRQREMIANALFYPRAERTAPGPHRVDQALTNHVLAAGCSSLAIEWTWAGGDRAAEQPWFGLDTAGGEAIFGYDRTLTPWPTAIRFTMTLHDPRGVLESGRVFQFVVYVGRE